MVQQAIVDASANFHIQVKNIEADKMAMETRMRKVMQDLVSPLVEQGQKHKEQFLDNIKALNDHESRVAFIEYAIFKSEKREDRFEEIYRKMGDMEAQRAADIIQLRSEWINHKSSVDAEVDQQNFKLDKVEEFQRHMDTFNKVLIETEERITNLRNDLTTKVTEELSKFAERLNEHHKKLRVHNEAIEEHKISL